MQNWGRVLLKKLMGRLDQPTGPVVGDVALVSRKLCKKLASVTLVLDAVVPLSAAHHVVKVSVLLRKVHLTFYPFQVDLELLDRVILCDHFDGTFKSNTLVLQLIAANGLLNERDIRSKIAAQLHSDLTE